MNCKTQHGSSETGLSVTTIFFLSHAGDDTVERRASVTKAVLASRELTEVTRCPRDVLVVQFEDNSTGRLGIYSDVEL